MRDLRLLVRLFVVAAVCRGGSLWSQSVSVEPLAAKLPRAASANAQPIGNPRACCKSPLTATGGAGRSALPLRTIAFYKDGTAFFERAGFVDGDALIHIDFTSAQMNDVLASVTVTDMTGGRIAGLGFDSATTLAEQLDKLHLNLGEDTTVNEFLGAMKGRGVEITGGSSAPVSGKPVAGKLLNVEVRAVPYPKTQDKGERRFISIVTASGGLRTIELTPLVEVRMTDTADRTEIGHYLQILATTHNPPMRHLTLEAKGTGHREIRVGYLGAVPAWQSTYRLQMTSGVQTAAASAAQLVKLEGFASVQNASDTDWTNVSITLVSDAARSGTANPDGKTAFSVPQPQTIRQSESLVVPIIETTLTAERVSFWAQREQGLGVRSAFWLRNEGTLTLDAGSFASTEDGVFAGKGEFWPMHPGERVLMPYGTDAAVKVEVRDPASQPVSRVRHIVLHEGVITLHHTYFRQRDALVTNDSDAARTVVIGLPESLPIRNMGPWHLATESPAVWTLGNEPGRRKYRFQVQIGPHASQTFSFFEEHTHPTHLDVASASVGELTAALHESGDNPQAAALLQPMIDAKKKLAAFDTQIATQTHAIDDVKLEEMRLRKNIAALKGTDEERSLAKRYADAMIAQEDKFTAVQQQRETLRQQRAAVEKTMLDQSQSQTADLHFANPRTTNNAQSLLGAAERDVTAPTPSEADPEASGSVPPDDPSPSSRRSTSSGYASFPW